MTTPQLSLLKNTSVANARILEASHRPTTKCIEQHFRIMLWWWPAEKTMLRNVSASAKTCESSCLRPAQTQNWTYGDSPRLFPKTLTVIKAGLCQHPNSIWMMRSISSGADQAGLQNTNSTGTESSTAESMIVERSHAGSHCVSNAVAKRLRDHGQVERKVLFVAEDIDALLMHCKGTKSLASREQITSIYQQIRILAKKANPSDAAAKAAANEALSILAQHAMATAWNFEPRHVCALALAYAELQTKIPDLLAKTVADLIVVKRDAFAHPAEITGCLHAFAKIGQHPGNEALAALCERASVVVAHLRPHDVAMILWSCAKLGASPSDELFEALCHRVSSSIQGFTAQNVANTLWAFGTMKRYPGKATLEQLCKRVQETIGDFTSQTVANVMWAFASLGHHPGRQTFDVICQHATDIVAHFDRPQAVANTLWAFAKLRDHNKDLLPLLCHRACLLPRSASPHEIVNMLWSVATLAASQQQLLDSDFVRLLCRQACDAVKDFNSHDLANALWSCAVMDALPHGLAMLHALQLDVASVFTCSFFQNRMQKQQLFQFLLSVDLQLPQEILTKFGMDACTLRSALRSVSMQQFDVVGQHESLLQRDVAATAMRLGRRYHTEAVDAKSGYTIDVLVDGRIAVEVDGPTHFLFDGRTPTGATLLKRRHLLLLGYHVVALPYFVWGQATQDDAKEALLTRLLDGGSHVKDKADVPHPKIRAFQHRGSNKKHVIDHSIQSRAGDGRQIRNMVKDLGIIARDKPKTVL
jgi:hypothetical protein